MRRLPKAGLALALVNFVVVVAVIILASPQAQARPQYKKQFDTLYKKHYTEATKCDMCHVGTPKDGNHNKYGKSLKEQLGEGIDAKKGVTNVEKIKGALKEVAKKDSDVDGKKYGDLIKDGKKPAGEGDQ